MKCDHKNMKRGIATGQTLSYNSMRKLERMRKAGITDRGTTISVGGPGYIMPVMKCARCGWSVSV